jgi:hypothetical protein
MSLRSRLDRVADVLEPPASVDVLRVIRFVEPGDPLEGDSPPVARGATPRGPTAEKGGRFERFDRAAGEWVEYELEGAKRWFATPEAK